MHDHNIKTKKTVCTSVLFVQQCNENKKRRGEKKKKKLQMRLKDDFGQDLYVADLPVEPDGLVAFWVDVISVHAQVAEFPPQAFGFDLLERRLADEVGGLEEHRCTHYFNKTQKTAREIKQAVLWIKNMATLLSLMK